MIETFQFKLPSLALMTPDRRKEVLSNDLDKTSMENVGAVAKRESKEI